MKNHREEKTASVFRWAARILGTGILLFFVSFIVVGKIPPIWNQPLLGQIQFVGIFLFLLGCVAGWGRDGFGAFLILIGYLIFLIVEGESPWPPGMFEFILLTGVLYLIAWWKSASRVIRA
jgi:hypothetical protein